MVALNKNTTDGTDKYVTTYYVRDPQGYVLAVYEHQRGETGNGTLTLTEQHLYGASRLGMRKRDLALNVANASEPTPPATHYELTNHLGNVMAVISDKASTTDEPTVVSLSDYYPFGMTEPGRSWNAGAEGYRYGFNTQENVPELGEGHTTALYWEYDGRLGRRWNMDPVGHLDESSYLCFHNNPNFYSDPEGDDPPQKAERYVVQTGDNLTDIAKKYDVSVSDLADWNDIEDPNKIKAGQEIYVSSPKRWVSWKSDLYGWGWKDNLHPDELWRITESMLEWGAMV